MRLRSSTNIEVADAHREIVLRGQAADRVCVGALRSGLMSLARFAFETSFLNVRRSVFPDAPGRRASTVPRSRGTQRFKQPVPAERPDRAPDPAGVGVFDARVAREVDAGPCEQSGVRQSVAGITVVEKNRCIRISAAGAWSVPVRRRTSGAGRDNFRDNRRDSRRARKSRSRLYLAFSLAAVRWPSG